MPTYRLYFIDGAGSIASVEAFSAASDVEAIQISRLGGAGRPAELWCRDRQVDLPRPEPRRPLPHWLTPRA